MRDIKFRGKTYQGKWIYGYCYKVKSLFDSNIFNWFIRNDYEKDEMIIPETLSQYTGLKDKNGVEIYEGDIVKNNWTSFDGKNLGEIWEVKFGEYDNSALEYGSGGNIGFYAYSLKTGDEEGLDNLPCNTNDSIEVIGNIYEDLKESGG